MSKNGKITAVVGPMASGKTEYILKESKRREEAGVTVRYFKAATDTRDKGIKSRNGQSADCTLLDPKDATNFYEEVRHQNDGTRADVIVIDEFQFLEDVRYVRHLNRLAANGHDIFVSGLELTSELNPFGLMPAIMCFADEVVKVKGYCELCQTYTPSIFTYADFNKIGNVTIESEEAKYLSLCRSCHLSRSLAK